MATSSTKKPFSYCPGGINFSELKTKSPSMARRLEKHQEPDGTESTKSPVAKTRYYLSPF